MNLRCDDGAAAQITPWVPIADAERKRRRMEPLEYERDRCQRPECRKVAWQHANASSVESLLREILMAVRR